MASHRGHRSATIVPVHGRAGLAAAELAQIVSLPAPDLRQPRLRPLPARDSRD